jgi:hypothetical protein
MPISRGLTADALTGILFATMDGGRCARGAVVADFALGPAGALAVTLASRCLGSRIVCGWHGPKSA